MYRNWTGAVTDKVIVLAMGAGIICGIFIDAYIQYNAQPIIYVAEASEIEPREVRIEVKIDWTTERIEKEIRDTFPEDPDTAVKIAKCESGLHPDIQSRHVLYYGQEKSFGLFQIHKPDWHTTALRLGYDNYQTEVQDNIKMARYIYEHAGKKWTDWSCYNKGMI